MKHTFVFILLSILQSCLIFQFAQKNDVIQLGNENSGIHSYTINNGIIYFVDQNTLKQYSLDSNSLVNSIDIQDSSPILSLIVHPNSKAIFLGTKSGELKTVSLETGKLITSKDYGSGAITALALSSDGQYLFCGCENGMVYQQSVENKEKVEEFYQHSSTITSIDVSNSKQLIAISSGDGTISLFKEPTYEWIEKLFVGNKWVRKVVINDYKDRLLCVGDDGKLNEWKISDIDNIRLITTAKVSSNWLLSLDVGKEGSVMCWGGINHFVHVRTEFGSYQMKLKGPVLKADILENLSNNIYVICCVHSIGIQIIPLKNMKFRSI